MPSLSGQCNPAIGPLIQVGVDAPAGSAAVTPARFLQPIAPNRLFSALVDTGAQITCISAAVVTAVGISPAGMRPMGSATQTSVATNTYVVDLGIVFNGINWWVPSLLVFEYVPPVNAGHQGRSLLILDLTAVLLGWRRRTKPVVRRRRAQ